MLGAKNQNLFLLVCIFLLYYQQWYSWVCRDCVSIIVLLLKFVDGQTTIYSVLLIIHVWFVLCTVHEKL